MTWRTLHCQIHKVNFKHHGSCPYCRAVLEEIRAEPPPPSVNRPTKRHRAGPKPPNLAEVSNRSENRGGKPR